MSEDRLVAGRYRLLGQLGRGGMGVVWRAQDERLDRTVAVKELLLPAGLTAHETGEVTRLAMREGRIAAKLQHPNLIMVYDVVEDAGRPYLIMEYHPSRALSDVLAERGSVSPGEAATIGAQAAAALAAAHAAGVVHRDVKPGNVLLGDDGSVKITDFGISRAVEDVTTTSTGIISGTPAYLSPEVAKGQRATFSSDVFSLGSTLYTAVEGTPPFGTADNSMALLYRVASEPVTPPRQAGPLTEVLSRLLRAEPEARPSMEQAGAELAEAARRAAESGRPTTVLGPAGTLPAQPQPSRAMPPTRTMPGPALAAGAAGAAAGAAAGGPAGGTAGNPAGSPAGGHGGTAGGAVGGRGSTAVGPPAGAAGGAAAAALAGYRTPTSPPTPVPSARPSAYPPPRPPGGAGGEGRRGGRALPLVLVGVVVLALTAVVWGLMLDGDDTPTDRQTPGPSLTGEPAGGATTPPVQPTTAQPTSEQGDDGGDEDDDGGGDDGATGGDTPTQPPSGGTPTQSLIDYYGVMPGDTESGWSRLTDRYRQNPGGGYAGYQRFWAQMRAVQVSGVTATGADTVEATVVYTFTTGKVVEERHRYTLVQQDGRWLIDQSSVLSSRTR
jgi:eukaryotic-like serine/threonine-protein kinase